MKKLLFSQKSNARMVAESMEPRGVHHTVSYATSYEETWNHIRSEVRSIYSNSPNLAPERSVVA
ncbi:hypothetical protein [Tunicatimonas pelagia]|uniref:hypothetical protein n=1 Tax=Tunicatimonas pelagia TaxID=931531 RepID=UPI002666F1E9|nr:hypothetical protein [Tunicatimonas pelagia]WKN45045.1 hypothetical protein P0M28_08715 [Tunicatimonas pelagia]